MLSSQFQAFCRDLHTECAKALVAPVSALDLQEALYGNAVFFYIPCSLMGYLVIVDQFWWLTPVVGFAWAVALMVYGRVLGRVAFDTTEDECLEPGAKNYSGPHRTLSSDRNYSLAQDLPVDRESLLSERRRFA